MHINSVAPSPAYAPSVAPKAVDPKNDGDADDTGSVKAPTPQGVGGQVDISAAGA